MGEWLGFDILPDKEGGMLVTGKLLDSASSVINHNGRRIILDKVNWKVKRTTDLGLAGAGDSRRWTDEDRLLLKKKEFLRHLDRSDCDGELAMLEDEWHKGQLILNFRRKMRINLMMIDCLLKDYDIFINYKTAGDLCYALAAYDFVMENNCRKLKHKREIPDMPNEKRTLFTKIMAKVEFKHNISS